ncbi:hypothetical protein FACS1894176_07630 [Bacteroidia bacterium]|nr:hypothetical protein FACS1894176_07630 [Bacteroidia bacterium]
MKQKILVLSLLFFVAVVSMQAQGLLYDGPKVLVKGVVVNTGKINSQLPVETRENGTINSSGAAGNIYAAGMVVGEGTTVTNGSGATLTVGEAPRELVIGNNHYSIGDFGAAGIWMTENLREIPDGGVLGKGNLYDVKYFNYPAPHETTDYTTLGADSAVNKKTYGYVYSWTAAMNLDDSRNSPYDGNLGNNYSQARVQGICPDGWHLPSDYEWTQLEKEIMMSTVYSTDLGVSLLSDTVNVSSEGMSTGTGFRVRDAANSNANSLDKKMRASDKIWTGIFAPGKSKSASEGGFSALPAGNWINASANNFGTYAYFWSSSSNSSSNVWSRSISSTNAGVGRNTTSKYNQLSVRCKKDLTI